MTNKEQELFFDNMVSQMKTIMSKKSKDYAGDDVDTDKLSNFKLAGDICGIGGSLNCLSLIATKVARLGVLLNSKQVPNNESIMDSVLDLANYTVLLAMILDDKVVKETDTNEVIELRKYLWKAK